MPKKSNTVILTRLLHGDPREYEENPVLSLLKSGEMTL